MPNWCHNIIEISGPIEELNLFERTMHKFNNFSGMYDDFCLNQTVPIPKKLYQKENIDSKEIEDWIYANWGCRDVFNVEININNYGETGLIIANCCSSWGPPEKWPGHMIKKFQLLSVKIHYYESGGCVYGTIEANKENTKKVKHIIGENEYDKDGKILENSKFAEFIRNHELSIDYSY